MRPGDVSREPLRQRAAEPAGAGKVPQQLIPVDAAVVRQLASRSGRTTGDDCWAAIRAQHPQEVAALQKPLDSLLSSADSSGPTAKDLYWLATAEVNEGSAELEAAIQAVRVLNASLEEATDRAKAIVSRQAWLHLVRRGASTRDLTLE
jgi:hypothetical protein